MLNAKILKKLLQKGGEAKTPKLNYRLNPINTNVKLHSILEKKKKKR